ncbi:hypothetical protein NLI96_g135 [Meripilus lineatus]|uniref:NAD-P-binding protein n=1 Tax=Meripilus lineatus TaxID=2056292 RepID=A0AAD5YP58_9APHY|nr:hypothetical protein NLI96_g135 [Physisporinus lineatus]
MGSAFSTKFNPETDVGDLSGKVIVVTGGNSGIGYATIQQLARRGAKVYMAARNEEKARAAIEKLKDEGLGPGYGEVLWVKLDLSDPRKAKAAAEEFKKLEGRLDVLVNNAALILVPYAISEDGIQEIMMTNVIGPFVFTMTLLPLLKATAKEAGTDVRIVNLSSETIRSVGSGIRFRNREDLNDEHANSWTPAFARYARTKIAIVLLTKELQRRLNEEAPDIVAICLHPGTVNTEGTRAYSTRVGGTLGAFYRWIGETFFITPTNGALNPVFAAAAPVVRAEVEKYKGAFLMPIGIITSPGKIGLDTNLAKELWGTLESILKEMGVEI